MPNKPKANKLQCRYCKQCSPAVEIILVKGKPQGECRVCNRRRQLKHRLHVSIGLSLFRSLPELIAANLKTLANLHNGTYSLAKYTDKTEIGYIIVKTDSIFVNIYNQADLFRYDLFGVAAYLGNSNAYIGDGKASPIDPEALDRFPVTDVQERLIWLDRVLLAKAAKLLKAEARAIEAALHVQNTPSNSTNASD